MRTSTKNEKKKFTLYYFVLVYLHTRSLTIYLSLSRTTVYMYINHIVSYCDQLMCFLKIL